MSDKQLETLADALRRALADEPDPDVRAWIEALLRGKMRQNS